MQQFCLVRGACLCQGSHACPCGSGYAYAKLDYKEMDTIDTMRPTGEPHSRQAAQRQQHMPGKPSTRLRHLRLLKKWSIAAAVPPGNFRSRTAQSAQAVPQCCAAFQHQRAKQLAATIQCQPKQFRGKDTSRPGRWQQPVGNIRRLRCARGRLSGLLPEHSCAA